MNFKAHLETAWHRLWEQIVPLIVLTDRKSTRLNSSHYS